jgi:uncharacterized protein
MTPPTLLIAFITGLTTGGLSCFAVQGGLLTSSIASYAEQKPVRGKRVDQPRVAQPILLFLSAKLVAHAIFGFLLGLVGTILSPSPVARGILQLAVGIFMVGNALRMLDVHPFFRMFSFEAPRSITRMIRKQSKKGQDWTTPVWLGALTIFIPCGITQIMMATAISTGSPWMGAALLSAFVLGASPTFFGVTYLAARVSALFEKQFMRVLAIVILLLGLYSIETGLNLSGSPISVTRAIASLKGDQPAASAPVVNTDSAEKVALPSTLNEGLATPDSAVLQLGSQTDLTINVKNSGYLPATIYAPAGKPINVRLVTNGVYSCSRAFVIPDLNFQQLLPATGETSLQIPAQASGKVLPFMCSMGMYTGTIIFQ